MKLISVIGASFKLSVRICRLLHLDLNQRLLIWQVLATTLSLLCDGKNYSWYPTTQFVKLMALPSLGFTIVAMMQPHAHCLAIIFTQDRSFFSPFIYSLSHL